ncbi:MAG TPA: M20/M25/M40 family metallo-hydrolase, partial [Acidobacteriota bacterium]|nr:M20/M25/M40 family metallo-hydrolase [Acidobacteriota bacterium]
TAVVTVGSIHAGNAFNVIAETAVFQGTVRYFDPELGGRLPVWMERVVSGICDSMGARYEWKYEKLTPPTINDATMAEFIRDISTEIVGKENVLMDAQTMGGEDMSFFLRKVPGCYFFIGAANSSKGLVNPHHSPKFDFDENALELGVEVFCRAVEKFLK